MLRYVGLETCPFQGISVNSIEDRKTTFGVNQLVHRKESIFMPLYNSLSQPSIFLSLVLSVICFILEMVGVGYGEGSRTMLLVLISILNWILVSV